ncbi:hypothetical protein NIES4071_90950 [Calothrix sp. NIES-4071]|nr:hypothetical protein NIES4071_90950 [Calothrix sp. NIES-4071]BAZ63362.1 hypothetical protein NIES4105_90880 [Calothrix sp. NIES-4105]
MPKTRSETLHVTSLHVPDEHAAVLYVKTQAHLVFRVINFGRYVVALSSPNLI